MNTDEERLVTDNLKLAYEISWKYYKKFNTMFELEELQSEAFLGLSKAAKTFNKDLGHTFSTYAYICIQNQVKMYYRDNKKYKNNLYLSDDVGDGIVLEDMITDNYDIVDDIDKEEYNKKLYEEINNLKGRYKLVIEYKLQGLTMVEIGKILNISQPQVSREYNKALNILRDRFKDWRDI